MAIFGVGALYGDNDVLGRFLERGRVGIGWSTSEAPPAHALLGRLSIGDIVFAKSFNPRVGLTIKAVGFVIDAGPPEDDPELGTSVPVKWTWRGAKPRRIGHVDDRWPMRAVSIYEELNPKVQAIVLDLALLGGSST